MGMSCFFRVRDGPRDVSRMYLSSEENFRGQLEYTIAKENMMNLQLMREEQVYATANMHLDKKLT